MAELPDDVLPGEIAEGPDGRYYRLMWSGEWHPATKGAFLDQEQRRRREAREERAAERPPPAAPSLPPPELPPSTFLSDRDGDEPIATIYNGEYAAVLAEAEGWQRADGWTGERRVLFLERLAEGGSVRLAARVAGVTRQAVWKLRQRAPAFAAAYLEAMGQSVELMAETAMDRAIHGTEQPVFHNGELVGHRIVHHDRLLEYLLRVRDPLNYAPIDELDRWQKHRPVPATASAGGPDRRELPAPIAGGQAAQGPGPG